MHAYVLLRKAQATKHHDAACMLDLASTAAHDPWSLPPRAQAEALQQEARALALTGAPADTITRTSTKPTTPLTKHSPPNLPAAPDRCAPAAPSTG
ncbi:hypothetical protein [Streptomyces sp. NPDC002467]|uniref:hypothetical protein n=1 Tax=Streptomyces sp. NPDC002467 TaxID=3364647 RepID=UPI0036BA6D73